MTGLPFSIATSLSCGTTKREGDPAKQKHSNYYIHVSQVLSWLNCNIDHNSIRQKKKFKLCDFDYLPILQAAYSNKKIMTQIISIFFIKVFFQL